MATENLQNTSDTTKEETTTRKQQYSMYDYLVHRMQNQQEWYDKKSSENKKLFVRNQTRIIWLGAIIPLLVILEAFLYAIWQQEWMKGLSGYLSAILSAIIAVTAGVDKLHQPQDNWYNYRANAEMLKKEDWLYEMKAGPYKGLSKRDRDLLLVERVESLIASDIAHFTQSEKERVDVENLSLDSEDEAEKNVLNEIALPEANEKDPQEKP